MRIQLINKGWRRHSVISIHNDALNHVLPKLPEIIQKSLSKTDSILLIATYDCAVVNPCFDNEPWVQLLVATPTDYQKKYANGRDPRRIHIKLAYCDQEQELEVCAAGICQIDREILCEIYPDLNYSLSESCKYDLKQWLAERYRQDTWPDSFNKAIRPANKTLKKFWKRYNDYLSGMYFKLNTYEELECEDYEAAIIVAIENKKLRSLMQVLKGANSQLEEKNINKLLDGLANEVLVALKGTIKLTPDPSNSLGISLEILEESQITVTHLRSFHRFSPYSLSEFGSNAPLPVDNLPGKSN